ncbi:MAG: hypothetical protein ACHQYQ_04290 [Bacteriovoracales bacterium]
MKIYKPLLAGMVLPSVILPFISLFVYLNRGGYSKFLLIAPFIPLIWGIWNILFINFVRMSPIIDREINIWIWGALLGFILVSFLSLFGLPKAIFNFSGFMSYGIFIFVPIAYGIAWRYFVKYFNETLDLY